MNKKFIILIIFALFIIVGGVFWYGQGDEAGKQDVQEQTLAERIKKEDPEIAARLAEEQEREGGWVASLADCELEQGKECIIRGTVSKTTDTFTLETGQAMGFSFFAMLKKLPSAKRDPAHIISVYRVGEEESVKTFADVTTRRQLQDWEWTPERREAGRPGVMGGVHEAFIEGPGEFYFKIEIENIDIWELEIRKGVLTDFTG